MQAYKEPETILDFGVAAEKFSIEANFFEKLFPNKKLITAASIENAAYLEEEYHGMKFVLLEEGRPLPFSEGQFDWTFSHAVIEHIVSDEARESLLTDIGKVSKRGIFLTTPNKFFPVEVHTRVPLLHFAFPNLFYKLCDKKVLSQFYNSKNLRLLGKQEFSILLKETLPAFYWELYPIRTFGFVSNWVAVGLRR